MSKTTSEGKVKVHYVPTIADKAAPTAAEIAAGTNLTPFTPTAGLAADFNQNNASINMLDDGFNAEDIGTEGATLVLTFTRDEVAANDDAWDLFVRGLSGFIVISRFGAPVATSRVEVWPIRAHRAVPLAPAENEYQQARVNCAVTGQPELRAVVAA